MHEKHKKLIFPEEYKSEIFPIRDKFPDLFITSPNKLNLTLGIGALSHDSAASLVDNQDGNILFATAEERLSNIKHDSRFPIGSIIKCCEYADMKGFSINSVAVNFCYEEFITKGLFKQLSQILDNKIAESITNNAIQKVNILLSPIWINKDEPLDCLISDMLSVYNFSEPIFNNTRLLLSWYMNVSFKYKSIKNIIEKLFPDMELNFINHHEAHAASAYFGSGEVNSSILVIDGHGESETTSIFHGLANNLTAKSSSHWPDSLGSLYLAATRYLGFDYGDEFKVMGMAAYGKPIFYDMLSEFVTVDQKNCFKLHENKMLKLNFVGKSGQMRYGFSPDFGEIVKSRKPGGKIEQEHFNFAASLQMLTEKSGVKLAKNAFDITGCNKMTITGGVGLNGLMNEAIRKSGFDDLFVYPASGDDGTSAGAAHAVLLKKGVKPHSRLQSCYFGNSSSEKEMEAILEKYKIVFTKPKNIHEKIALALDKDKIVSRYTSAAEFGPRALGNRSLMANPSKSYMKDVLNLRVKHREDYRPFAPACLLEYANDFFEFDGEAPFMVLVVRARQIAKEKCPAIVHEDGTARLQTVTSQNNPDFYKTISAFNELTNIPMVINTSFNVNGETIVNDPQDAVESFGFMDIDCLALGPFWVEKSENSEFFPDMNHGDYLRIRNDRYNKSIPNDLKRIDLRAYGPWFYQGV
jgi:carbamoyltransferase